MLTHCAKKLSQGLLMTAAAMAFSTSAWAMPERLSDDEMRTVNGGQQQTALPNALNGLPSAGLFDLLSLDKLNAEKSKLSPAEFAAAVKAAGLGNALQLGYDGQGGSQITLGSGKLNAQFGLSDIVAAGAGSFNSNASMGMISIGNLDTTGTRLLMWHH
ncbi:hypothetical protein WG899_13360 [Paucibacter sp. AS339]|uniref:hypothetical protein n=1 Tax=Paucibacter hankyongi TaxID=3133434 RepID=UPI0030A211B6